MYHYQSEDQTLLRERIAEFRGQIQRRLAGELTEEEFKPLRLMNGLYLQLHAYMLRVAIPYGTLSADQMRALAHIARAHDKSYGHFTTRQNIQFNWISLEDMPAILDALAAVDMHAIQTSGNCIRNITTDPFAGVAHDEVDDARIYCEIIRQWSTLHPEFSFLPRKFKIAVSAAEDDRAAIAVHDIGLILKRVDGDFGFEVQVGGGQGRTPRLARTIHAFLPQRDLLAYLEAILRVYNLHGRRDNKYKARIKILVDALGAEAFAEQVEAEWWRIRGGALDLSDDAIEQMRDHFAPPPYADLDPNPADLATARTDDPLFAAWLDTNVHPHRRDGYAIVTLPLKVIGGIPGDITADQMDAVADLADRYSFGEIRTTYAQNLVFAHVRRDNLKALWMALDGHDLATPNAGLATDIIACPGLDYCALANTRSIPVAQQISERFAALDRQHDIGELSIKISGCINACGHHHVGDIGVLGVDRRGEEFYQITLGGRADQNASLGAIVGPAFGADAVVDAVETIVDTYLTARVPGERFIDTYRRVGIDAFKEPLYGAD